MPGLVLQVGRQAFWIACKTPMAAMAKVRDSGEPESWQRGGAQGRHRRRLREVARLVLSADAAPGHDYVLIGRAATLKRPFAMLVVDLRSALRELRAHRPASGANHAIDAARGSAAP